MKTTHRTLQIRHDSDGYSVTIGRLESFASMRTWKTYRHTPESPGGISEASLWRCYTLYQFAPVTNKRMGFGWNLETGRMDGMMMVAEFEGKFYYERGGRNDTEWPQAHARPTQSR